MSNETIKLGKLPKLDLKYLGSLIITQKLNALNYAFEPNNEGRELVIHFNSLRPCIASFEELVDVINTENATEDIITSNNKLNLK